MSARRITMLAPFGIRPKGTLSARMLPLAQALPRRGHRVSIVAPPVQNPGGGYPPPAGPVAGDPYRGGAPPGVPSVPGQPAQPAPPMLTAPGDPGRPPIKTAYKPRDGWSFEFSMRTASGDMLGQVLGVYLTFWIGWLSATALLVVLYRLFSVQRLRWPATVWGALATGSFLAGMSLGWVLVLRYGVAVGRAFGGSVDVGRVVLFTVYLLLVQVTVLLGYLLVLSIDAHLTSTPDSGPEV